MNKKLIIIFIFLFSFQKSLSQKKDTIYVDEHYKEINKKEFELKTKSTFFVIATTTNDTVVFKKIRFREYFGKLDAKKKLQLNKLLFSKHKIDTTKTWFIQHYDKLPDVEKFYAKSGIILLDSLGREFGEIMSIREFNQKHIKRLREQTKIDFLKTHRGVRSFKDYQKMLLKRKKQLKKFKRIEVLHFYSHNKNYPIEKGQIDWKRDDNLVFQNVFTDGNRIFNNVIIYPNGYFYAHSGRASLNKQKSLLKFKNYKKLEEAWRKEFYKSN